MAKFRIDRDVVSAEGTQTFEVEAENLEEAIKKFDAGESEIVEHEVEVVALSHFDNADIYEYQD